MLFVPKKCVQRKPKLYLGIVYLSISFLFCIASVLFPNYLFNLIWIEPSSIINNNESEFWIWYDSKFYFLLAIVVACICMNLTGSISFTLFWHFHALILDQTDLPKRAKGSIDKKTSFVLAVEENECLTEIQNYSLSSSTLSSSSLFPLSPYVPIVSILVVRRDVFLAIPGTDPHLHYAHTRKPEQNQGNTNSHRASEAKLNPEPKLNQPTNQ